MATKQNEDIAAFTTRSDNLLREQARKDFEEGSAASGMRDVYYEEIERLCEAEAENE